MQGTPESKVDLVFSAVRDLKMSIFELFRLILMPNTHAFQKTGRKMTLCAIFTILHQNGHISHHKLEKIDPKVDT